MRTKGRSILNRYQIMINSHVDAMNAQKKVKRIWVRWGKIKALACGTNSMWQPTDKCYMHALKFLWNETKKKHILVHGADNLLSIEKLSSRKKVFAHNKKPRNRHRQVHANNELIFCFFFRFMWSCMSVIYSAINYNFCFTVANSVHGLIRCFSNVDSMAW